MVCVSSYALANEVSDDTRFKKRVSGGLMEVRNLTGDGLFTVRSHRVPRDTYLTLAQAQDDEPNWGIARRHRSTLASRR